MPNVNQSGLKLTWPRFACGYVRHSDCGLVKIIQSTIWQNESVFKNAMQPSSQGYFVPRKLVYGSNSRYQKSYVHQNVCYYITYINENLGEWVGI